MWENLVKKLMTSTKCAVCGRHYRVEDINVLGHEDTLWFLTVSCPTCNTDCQVAAVIQEEGVPEAVTDLTEAEEGRLEGVAAVAADDVLNMHQFLEDFDGGFRRLFGKGWPE